MLERFDFETIRIQVVILSEYFPEYSGELNKMVQFETSKQLDQFSKIFYKKIKINNTIDEL